MITSSLYPHLQLDENGSARIANTRYQVLHLAAEHYHLGWSAEELLRQHPDLRPEQVYAALGYFYDQYEAMLIQMAAFDERGQTRLQNQTLTREELLQRRGQKKG
jgi:uncharacterized protein (DUF433 family)